MLVTVFVFSSTDQSRQKWPSATQLSPVSQFLYRPFLYRPSVTVYTEDLTIYKLCYYMFQTGGGWRWSAVFRSWSWPGRGRCSWGPVQRSTCRLLGSKTNAHLFDSRWLCVVNVLRWTHTSTCRTIHTNKHWLVICVAQSCFFFWGTLSVDLNFVHSQYNREKPS